MNTGAAMLRDLLERITAPPPRREPRYFARRGHRTYMRRNQDGRPRCR